MTTNGQLTSSYRVRAVVPEAVPSVTGTRVACAGRHGKTSASFETPNEPTYARPPLQAPARSAVPT